MKLEKDELILDEETEASYDKVCAVLFSAVWATARGSKAIVLTNINLNNAEHRFIIHGVKAAAGVSRLPVYLDISRFQLKKLNSKIDKDCHFLARSDLKQDEQAACVLSVEMLLSLLRTDDSLMEFVDEDFDFGKIYEAYYA